MKYIFIFIFLATAAMGQERIQSVGAAISLINSTYSNADIYVRNKQFNFVGKEDEFYRYQRTSRYGDYSFSLAVENSRVTTISWTEWLGNVSRITSELQMMDFQDVKGNSIISSGNRTLLALDNLQRNLVVSIIIRKEENDVLITVSKKFQNKPFVSQKAYEAMEQQAQNKKLALMEIENNKRRKAQESRQQKINELRSKTYDMDIEQPELVTDLKRKLMGDLVDQIKKQNTSEDKNVKAKYIYTYSDQQGTVGSGIGKFIKVEGNSDRIIDNVKEYALSHQVEDIQVPIKYSIKDIDLNYSIGRSQVKVTKKGVKFQSVEPSPEIKDFIVSRMKGRTGIYSLEYIIGTACGYSIDVLYEEKGQTIMGTVISTTGAIR